MRQNDIMYFCCRKIEETFNHGPSNEWTHHDFILLGEDIEIKTGVIISETTLKRLFGKRTTQSDYLPQITTLDALACYVGYKDWQDIKNAAIAKANIEVLSLENADNKTIIKKSLIKNLFYVLLLIITVLFFGIYYILEKNKELKSVDFQFTVRNQKDTIPFTAIFDYHILPGLNDTFFVNIPESELGNYPLIPGNKVFTHWFRHAGYFPVTLQYKGQILDTISIYAQSNDWQSGITRYPDIKQFVPIRRDLSDRIKENRLYLSPFDLEKQGIDSLSNYMTEFRLFKSFGISLDDFNVSLIARNSPAAGGKPCYDIDIEMIGEKGCVRAVFIDKKCFRFSQLTISEINYNGQYNDLSMFATDVKKWKNFQISIQKKLATIRIDENKIYRQAYQNPIGMLKGVIIRFFGSGQAKSLKIENGKGEVLLFDQFD